MGLTVYYRARPQRATLEPLAAALNALGFAVGAAIGAISLVGFRNTGSPTLLRLAVAFSAIGAGFLPVWAGGIDGVPGWVGTLGIAMQAVGYFFIAFSHSMKAFLPRSGRLTSISVLPLFLGSYVQMGHIVRSISFILLAYGAIETMLSYMENRRPGTAMVAAGLVMLALGEFLSWYALVYPESPLLLASSAVKIGGLLAIFVPVSRVAMAGRVLGRAGQQD